MGTIRTADGTEIYDNDWGEGQPIVFSHGWPRSADDWDTRMLFFLQHGYRVIAHDRRGHGRSDCVFAQSVSGFHEGQQVGVDCVGLGGGLVVRETVVPCFGAVVHAAVAAEITAAKFHPFQEAGGESHDG